MLHITLICIGKLNAKYYADAVNDYSKRLGVFCRFNIIEIAEEPINEKNISPALVNAVLKKEAQKIDAAIPKGAKTVCLCIDGKKQSSEEFAAFIEKTPNMGISHLAFIIGSSHGLDMQITNNAFLKLSLSNMTMPHQMARLFLTEQIYRAFMINSGAKYHK